ncbi:probable prolyl 4-hydroxylase 7 isoform X2 [Typha angustifolia]|uniref:probable prolyl 4-hydroxylase 7 isoform X2 n=1 Tax=Typha angustifolia TaxID=59011 RepID=UPI003C2F1C2C
MASSFPITFLLLIALWISPPMCSSRMIELRTRGAKLGSPLNVNSSNLSSRFNPSKAKQLSWRPRVFLYEGFLSDEECDHLIALTDGSLKRFSVVENDTGSSTLNSIPTSTMMLSVGYDGIVSKIEERISLWTFLPKENGGDMQILHFRVNESYGSHFDYSQDKPKLVSSGDRIATVLMYLSNVTLGGETVFPKSELKATQDKDEMWSECASTHYAVKPVKGNALLLFNFNPDATPDDSSLHSDCLVVDGEKWSAVKYIYARSFNSTKPLMASDDECTDEDDNCPQWAAIGECQRNPVFMSGSPDYYGTCRKSCKVC